MQRFIRPYWRSFIAFNELPNLILDSFYLDLTSHMDRKMTGPYHAIASLSGVLRNHRSFREAVVINKSVFLEKMKKYITFNEKPTFIMHQGKL